MKRGMIISYSYSLHDGFLSADFFQNYIIYISSIRVSNSLDLLVVIWIQTVCKDYQQMTEVATSMESGTYKSQF